MINRIVLEGRLTKDPELKKTQSGLSCCFFTLACDKNYGRQGEDGKPTADFISCIAWKQQAEYLNDFGEKGSLIVLEGRIQTRNYDGSDGKRVYVTEVVAERLSVHNTRKKDHSGIANKSETTLYKTDIKPDKHTAVADYSDLYEGMGENIDPDDLPF